MLTLYDYNIYLLSFENNIETDTDNFRYFNERPICTYICTPKPFLLA